MYKVGFVDTVHGLNVVEFEDFDSAAEYWNDYADTETCVSGWLIDNSTGEIIWEFDEKKA